VNDCDDHDCTRVYLSASLSPEYCHILTKVLNIFWGTVWLFDLLGALRYVNYFRTYDVIFADNGPYGGMTTRGGTCVPPTVIYTCRRVSGSTLYTAVGRSQLLARWPGTHSRILSGIQWAAQTVLGVYSSRVCSRVTSASSALGVLNNYVLYTNPRTYSLTHSLTHYIKTLNSTTVSPIS